MGHVTYLWQACLAPALVNLPPGYILDRLDERVAHPLGEFVEGHEAVALSPLFAGRSQCLVEGRAWPNVTKSEITVRRQSCARRPDWQDELEEGSPEDLQGQGGIVILSKGFLEIV